MLSLLKNRRTIRKFKQDEIDWESLLKMVDCARLAPSAANLQPLKYKIICGEDAKKMFPHTAWAGYSGGAETPKDNEAPVAYILILEDIVLKQTKFTGVDVGAAGMSITVAAESMGIKSCWLGSLDREKIAEEFNIDARFVINSAIALGYPLDTAAETAFKGDVKYFRDENGKFLVPKRSIEDILI